MESDRPTDCNGATHSDYTGWQGSLTLERDPDRQADRQENRDR